MQNNINKLESIFKRSNTLDRKNQLLKAKYEYDEKYARIHKRLIEKSTLTISENKLFEALISLKKETDTTVLQNTKILENESYVEKMISRLIIDNFQNKHKIQLDSDKTKFINRLMVNEYINEFEGKAA